MEYLNPTLWAVRSLGVWLLSPMTGNTNANEELHNRHVGWENTYQIARNGRSVRQNGRLIAPEVSLQVRLSE